VTASFEFGLTTRIRRWGAFIGLLAGGFWHDFLALIAHARGGRSRVLTSRLTKGATPLRLDWEPSKQHTDSQRAMARQSLDGIRADGYVGTRRGLNYQRGAFRSRRG
jgi:hypothetical protein